MLLLVSILKFMKYICYYMFHYSDNILSKKTICYSKDGNFALVHSGASPEAHPSDQSSGGWSLHYLLFFIIIYFIIFCYYCRNILNKLWATNRTYIFTNLIENYEIFPTFWTFLNFFEIFELFLFYVFILQVAYMNMVMGPMSATFLVYTRRAVWGVLSTLVRIILIICSDRSIHYLLFIG